VFQVRVVKLERVRITINRPGTIWNDYYSPAHILLSASNETLAHTLVISVFVDLATHDEGG
jgi:hypothetical protein